MDSQKTKEVSDNIKEGVRLNKKAKSVPVSELTREELEARLLQLEAHNKQLQNLLAKSQGAENGIFQSCKKSKKERPFDFSKHSKRHVLLKFAYLGWDYGGFAVQEDTQQTIEAQLFSALLKTRLIESRETSNYHRCGRTDKGVSAFDQVVSITLRSRLSSGVGLVKSESCVSNETEDDDSEEINYVSLLNKVLPPEIRMLAWCPVAEGYSARFDCAHRTYKYFFPRGNLDIRLMNEAAQHLTGYHDYRNFCKMDVGNGVVNFCRCIQAIDICDTSVDAEKNKINPLSMDFIFEQRSHERKTSTEDRAVTEHVHDSKTKDSRKRTRDTIYRPENTFGTGSKNSEDSYDMCVATIEGQAFLWHQVRAIMGVLFLIGEGKEEPSIIQELLDVEKHPRKPQYNLASDLPLNLYKTAFPGIVWRYDEDSLRSVVSQLQALWTQHSVRSAMIRHMLWDLETLYLNHRNGDTTEVTNVPKDQSECLVPGAKTKVYRPLLTRPTCESLETRVDHYIKRRRLEPDILRKIAGDASVE